MIIKNFDLYISSSIQKGDILTVAEDVQVKVLKTPNTHRYSWYMKILNFVSFGLLYKKRDYYKVKTI